MLEEKKALIRRYVEEILNKRNLALIEEMFTGDSLFRSPSMPEFRGLEGRKQLVTAIHAGLPDVRYTIEDLLSEDDKVAVRWSAVGSHQGEWMGMPPTGKQLSTSGICIFRISDGKIAEEFVEFDALGQMRQLSVSPPVRRARPKPRPKAKPKTRGKVRAQRRTKTRPGRGKKVKRTR